MDQATGMRILGIETSCDETSAAIVENGTTVLSLSIASSKTTFAKAGGVIPEDAAREQVRCMLPVLQEAFENAKLTYREIDAIAVTAYPGLLGSLLVGTTTARMLQWCTNMPLIPVHHTLGHLDSIWLHGDQNGEPTFPCLTLSVSGGHTDLWRRMSHTIGQLVATTRDDAAGEAFDKGALLLGLPYPGGPSIANAAEGGDPVAFAFPHPLPESMDFSFSGLKTALKYLLRDLPASDHATRRADLAASYQEAICHHLTDRVRKAVETHRDCREVHVVGGVSANQRLRSMLRDALPSSVILRTPEKLVYCTDNAAMIAAAGYFQCQEKPESRTSNFLTAATHAVPLEH